MRRALKRITWLRVFYRFLFRMKVQQTLVRLPVYFIFRALGLRLLRREDFRKDPQRFRLVEYGEAETITAPAAITDGDISEKAARALGAYSMRVERPFTVELDDVQLVGRSALGFACGGALIVETMPPSFSWRDIVDNTPASTLLASRAPARGAERIDAAFSLVHAWHNNYCMWLSESLARLEGLEAHEARTGRQLPIIIPMEPARYVTESLALMGCPRERLVEWSGARLHVGTLVVSSFRREYRGEHNYRVALNGLRWLRGKMLAGLDGSAPALSPRVFISRRKALARRIANEDEVAAALAPLGFQSYALEEMSFADQVRLFAQAETIVAPHGAGLMNLAFATRPRVVELFGNFIQPSFSELARGLGFPYGYLECRAPRGDIRPWDADLVVEIPALLRLVEKMQRSS